MMGHRLQLGDLIPRLHESVFLAPTAVVVGDVEVLEGSSIWYQAVLRGDVVPIHVGRRVNLQDGAIVHGSSGGPSVHIGDDTTIGHAAIVHGATLHGATIVGMGAVLLDEVVVERHCLIGARTLLTQRTHIPEGSLVLGSPGKVVRRLTEEEIAGFERSAEHYQQQALRHAAAKESHER